MEAMAAAANLPHRGRAAPDDPGDAATLARLAGELADRIELALPRWVRESVDRRLRDWGAAVPHGVVAAADQAGRRAASEVGSQVRALLTTDVDHQGGNPMALLRAAVRYPAGVLRAAGVPPVVRDAFAEQAFPDDDYDLTPATFADLDPALHQPGLLWGAAKAHVVLARRRSEGRR